VGQATITVERGDGLYEILIDRGLGRIVGQIEAISLRIVELEQEADSATQSLVDAQMSGEREQLQIVLDGAIEAYRLAVDERCTQESYKIPPIEEFQESYAGIRDAEDAYFQQVNEIGRLNQSLAQSTSNAFQAEQDIAFWESRLAEWQENLDYFSDLYAQAWDAAVECATKGTNCEPNWLFSLQELLFMYGVAVMAYQEQVVISRERLSDAQDALQTASAEIEAIEAQIEDANELLERLKDAMDAARKEYQAVVTKLRPITDICDPRQFVTEQQLVDEAVKAIGEYDIEITRLKGMMTMALAHLLSARLQLDRLQEAAEASLIYRDAWCADLTLDASGGVGTIEIPGEPQDVLIVPGAAAPTDDDGFLLARAAMTPAQSAANIALLPGWQKWRPTYRVGTLIDKDDDMNAGQVDLDDARSSATGIGTISPITGVDWGGPKGDPAGLAVNQGDLGWIPFQYMDCDSLAFSSGDRVVVRFDGQNWLSPVIIGFESHPVDCGFLDPVLSAFYSTEIYSVPDPFQAAGLTSQDYDNCNPVNHPNANWASNWNHRRVYLAIPGVDQYGRRLIYDSGQHASASLDFRAKRDWTIIGAGTYAVEGAYSSETGPLWVIYNWDGCSTTISGNQSCVSVRPADYHASHALSTTKDPNPYVDIWRPPLTWPPNVTPPPSTVTLTGRVWGRTGRTHTYSIVRVTANGVVYQIDPE